MKQYKNTNLEIPENKNQLLDDPEIWDDLWEFPEKYEDDYINEGLYGNQGGQYR